MDKTNNGMLSIYSLVIVVFAILSNYVPVLRILLVVSVIALQLYLFKNAQYFSNHERGSAKWRTYRYLMSFSMVMVIAVYCYHFVVGNGTEERNSYLFVMLLVAVFGNLSPKIGFNRTLGIRLPWTLRDEDTWRYAHRICGYCTFPIIIIVFVAFLMNQENLMKIGIILWVLIPSVASYIYDRRKGEC